MFVVGGTSHIVQIAPAWDRDAIIAAASRINGRANKTDLTVLSQSTDERYSICG